jgi:hypothetical protein
MLDDSGSSGHSERNLQGGHSTARGSFGDARGLVRILRPDHGDQA